MKVGLEMEATDIDRSLTRPLIIALQVVGEASAGEELLLTLLLVGLSRCRSSRWKRKLELL